MDKSSSELQLLREIILGIPELLIVVSESGRYIDIGGISEHDPNEVVGKTIADLFPANIVSQFTFALADAFSNKESKVKTIEYKLTPSQDLKINLPENNERWFQLRINPLSIRYKEERIAVCICRDITDKKHYENNLIALSEKDFLAGIFNRSKLFERLEGSLEEYQRYGKPFSLMLFDIDDFKLINDRYGHLAGDEVIRMISNLCSHQHRKVDTFARIGGDEFAIVLPNIELAQAHEFAQRITELVDQMELVYDGKKVPVSISVGICCAESTDRDIESVFCRADQAMYRAKQQGKNRVGV